MVGIAIKQTPESIPEDCKEDEIEAGIMCCSAIENGNTGYVPPYTTKSRWEKDMTTFLTNTK